MKRRLPTRSVKLAKMRTMMTLMSLSSNGSVMMMSVLVSLFRKCLLSIYARNYY
jgi:hypothetical protein